MKLLLDTHLLLWAAGSPDRLPVAARSLLEDTQNELLFSAASLWEIVIKRGLGPLGISKRGNRYIRTLLIHGARSVLKNCSKKTDKLSLWLQALVVRRGFNKAAVALANKNARILWAMANKNKEYEALVA